MKNKSNTQLCGIDEAGRGALAGPLAVAACVLKREIDGLNDSKKLTAKRREELFAQIAGNSEFLIVYFSNEQIDELGLSECLRRALRLFMAHFTDRELLYDGNANYGTGIKTMIGADGKVAQVSNNPQGVVVIERRGTAFTRDTALPRIKATARKPT